MHGAELEQLFHSGSQFSVAHRCEVIEREEVEVLSQVTWQAVKLVENPEGQKKKKTTNKLLNAQVTRALCYKQGQNKSSLFRETAGPEEIFHVEKLHP